MSTYYDIGREEAEQEAQDERRAQYLRDYAYADRDNPPEYWLDEPDEED